MSRTRKTPPGVDPKLLIKDAAKLLPQSSRRLFLRGAVSLGALSMLTGCDIVDGPTSENVLRVISRFNDQVQALSVLGNHAGAGISGKRDHPAVSVQRLLQRRRGAGCRRRHLQARDRRPGRQQEVVDAARAQSIAGGLADHPPCLRRRLERHRLLAGRAAFRFSQADRRRSSRAKYVWFQCAEGYSNTIDMPTALHPQTQLTFKFDNKNAADRLRLPDQDPHPDQARLQEPEIRHRHVGAEQRCRRLLGEPGLQLVQRAVETPAVVCLTPKHTD